MDFSCGGSSKRVRMPGSGSQVPSCLVDGCFSDLSKCRDYHRRHKVCEPHSKASKVFIKGVEQRFCQQCSRFHSLVEFDEGKRSCRKRLEGHNRRRRKTTQPDSLSADSPRLFSNHQGTRYIHFGDSTVYTASTPTTAALCGVVKVEDDPMIYNCQTSLNSSDRKTHFPRSSSNKGKDDVKQFPFLQSTTTSSSTTPMFPGDQANAEAGPKMFSEGLIRVMDSNRALSLLSSPPQAESTQSFISTPNYNNSMGMESQHLGPVLVPGMSRNANIHPNIMFHLLPDGSSSSGSQQKVSKAEDVLYQW